MLQTHEKLARVARRLGREAEAIKWRTPSHVYNPLQYAWSGHREYLARYGDRTGRVLLLGMNPGPWGMAQTGVPFGTVAVVRDWFGIETKLAARLPVQHPKYPILGMACQRREGSGQRVWGWARERFVTPERFFQKFFVWNYCPLLFLGHGRNLTPVEFTRREANAVDALCNAALRQVLDLLQPVALVGIGRYAEQRARDIAGDDLPVAYLPHPSPANPRANREWPAMADAALAAWLPHARGRS